MVIRSVRAGIGQLWVRKRLLVPFYLANLLCGILVMLPLGMLLDDFVGHSMMRERLGAAMDYDFLFEFLMHRGDALTSVKGVAMMVPGVYWLLALFLSGGAFAVLARETYSPSGFWGGAATWFGPFLRLFLWSIPVFALLFCLRYIETLVQWLIFGADPYEYVIYWGAWIKTALGYLGLILFGLVFDYARIHMVLTGRRQARKSLWYAMRLAAGHLARTFALAFLLLCAGWLVLLVYDLISGTLSAPSWIAVVLLLALQQLYIIFRMALRLTAYASQMHLYGQLSV